MDQWEMSMWYVPLYPRLSNLCSHCVSYYAFKMEAPSSPAALLNIHSTIQCHDTEGNLSCHRSQNLKSHKVICGFCICGGSKTQWLQLLYSKGKNRLGHLTEFENRVPLKVETA